MNTLYLWILGYFVVGMLLWEFAPQTMNRFMPRDHRTHKLKHQFSTFIAITIFWPLALLQRR